MTFNFIVLNLPKLIKNTFKSIAKINVFLKVSLIIMINYYRLLILRFIPYLSSNCPPKIKLHRKSKSRHKKLLNTSMV
jgi:hypothetical protein